MTTITCVGDPSRIQRHEYQPFRHAISSSGSPHNGNRFDTSATNSHELLLSLLSLLLLLLLERIKKTKSLIPNMYVYVVTAFFFFVCEAKMGGTSILIELGWNHGIGWV